jgi:hypothetical protein
MTVEIAVRVSGLLFLSILATLAASVALGNMVEVGDSESDNRLDKINKDPKKFQLSIVFGHIEGVRIIALVIMLFIAFSSYNIILAVVWTTCRVGEGLILIYSGINYRGLLDIAGKYSITSDTERSALEDAGRIILQTRSSRWTLATTLMGIGTLAYSILFVAYGLAPSIIGWMGILVGILLVFVNGTKLVKPDFKASKISKTLDLFGGLGVILFEVIIGGWLLFFPQTS